MEISQEDRMKILDDVLAVAGREDDEFTVREMAEKWNILPANVLVFLETNKIKHTRRKAFANGRRQYVYKLFDIINKKE